MPSLYPLSICPFVLRSFPTSPYLPLSLPPFIPPSMPLLMPSFSFPPLSLRLAFPLYLPLSDPTHPYPLSHPSPTWPPSPSPWIKPMLSDLSDPSLKRAGEESLGNTDQYPPVMPTSVFRIVVEAGRSIGDTPHPVQPVLWWSAHDAPPGPNRHAMECTPTLCLARYAMHKHKSEDTIS
jgi:hypothetical protein